MPFPGFEGDPKVVEKLDFPASTNPTMVWKETRRRQYELIYRPDTYTANQDFEALVVTRGDRVQLSHDVLDRTMVSARVRGSPAISSTSTSASPSRRVRPMPAGSAKPTVRPCCGPWLA